MINMVRFVYVAMARCCLTANSRRKLPTVIDRNNDSQHDAERYGVGNAVDNYGSNGNRHAPHRFSCMPPPPRRHGSVSINGVSWSDVELYFSLFNWERK